MYKTRALTVELQAYNNEGTAETQRVSLVILHALGAFAEILGRRGGGGGGSFLVWTGGGMPRGQIFN